MKSIIATFLLAVIACLAWIYGNRNITSSAAERYISHIEKLQQRVAVDGPGKAYYRDALMTMNPQTGLFNPKAKLEAIQGNTSVRRDDEARDFEWRGVSTEVSGRTRTMMPDPTIEGKLWSGAVTGGLWYTNDFRSNARWSTVSDNWETLSISCMTYDPANPLNFYVGTGESYTSVNIYRESTSSGVGIYHSPDGGQTWSIMESTRDFDYINDLLVRTEDGKSVIYAAVASGIYQGKIFNSTPSDGLYRSEDGGVSWTQVLPNIPGSSVPYMVSDIESTTDGKMYIGTMRNLENKGGGYILSSTDGVNWTIENNFAEEALKLIGEAPGFFPGRVILRAAPSNPAVVYALGTGGFINQVGHIRDQSQLTFIARTYDGGQSWDYIDPPSRTWASIPWHALALDVDPNDPYKLLVGGLDTYINRDTRNTGELSWFVISYWAAMYGFSERLRDLYGFPDSDELRSQYVHADIHSIQYVGNSSSEVLFATDGGIQYTADMTEAYSDIAGDRLSSYPSFGAINNGLNTTQYYSVALAQKYRVMDVIGGTQDNSTHIVSGLNPIRYASLINGGDGAYCFFDSTNAGVEISSSQQNNYVIWNNGEPAPISVPGGTFINPALYDDRSNLLYTNLAVDGGFEILSPDLSGRYLDSIAVVNVGNLIDDRVAGGLVIDFYKIGTESQAAFSAFAMSPRGDKEFATMVIGNQLGDVYLTTGLPYFGESVQIDNDQLPFGYISSVDFGDTDEEILVTFSNYGVKSVWYTADQGETWVDLERNLPDLPVRDAHFNPFDDNQIIIATELGIWGLEDISDESAEWTSYNEGFPNVRVDMIAMRKIDSTIVAATHGRGIFRGKLRMKEQQVLLSTEPITGKLTIYPNPAVDYISIDESRQWISAIVADMQGRTVKTIDDLNNPIPLNGLPSGFYILRAQTADGEWQSKKFMKR